MKRINKYIFSLIAILFFTTACDEGFDELNTDPVRQTSVDPTFQLNYAIINSAYGYNNLTYETTIVRHMITPFIGVGTGGNLNQDNRAATQGNWQNLYRNVLKNIIDGIENSKDDPDRENLMNILKIWKAHATMVLTDTYGDIPYSEAGMAYIDGVVFPAYDSQQAIYTSLLSELEQATAALNPANRGVPQEIMYGGNLDQWKKLGNSLMLRAAMRLVKVDPGLAEQYTKKAISGGLMESNADNAVVRHDANYRNNVGTNLNGGQAPFYYLDQEFVNFMKTNNDPRLVAIAVRYVGANQEGDQIEDNADRTFDAQIGMPQGYDNSSIPPIAAADGLNSLYDYSQLDRNRLGNPEAPSFLVTYSQTMLLYAEAIARGWATGDIADAYAKGIQANMRQFSLWPGETTITEADIDAYIAANPLVPGMEIEQINNQYWVSSFLVGPESWANFRRSGFPTVAPNKYPGSDLKTEDFIRRLTYPDSELTVNKVNVDAATNRQGPDILDTRVWWDVKQ
ncbi:MAG: SusD/RagB family nutrient-binding outer membrane lipoprotein [Flammeovirgaceae bacterium]|nr:SusD/RagB family nutrient-binding outer membrane lipoprotein [Flammeovirgaceae bacterium]